MEVRVRPNWMLIIVIALYLAWLTWYVRQLDKATMFLLREVGAIENVLVRKFPDLAPPPAPPAPAKEEKK